MPISARRSAFSVTLVWLGFPMIITGAMTGSILVLGMGFSRALTAMIIGNLIMFAYVGLLGLIGTKRGMNFFMSPSNMDLQDLLLKQLRKSEVWG